MARYRLLLAVLVYVTLDLSLPGMPGAFVFDPAGSVESLDVGRARLTAKATALPSPVPRGDRLSQPLRPDRPHGLRPSGEIARPGGPVVSCLPRATCTPPRPSDDPH